MECHTRFSYSFLIFKIDKIACFLFVCNVSIIIHTTKDFAHFFNNVSSGTLSLGIVVGFFSQTHLRNLYIKVSIFSRPTRELDLYLLLCGDFIVHL